MMNTQKQPELNLIDQAPHCAGDFVLPLDFEGKRLMSFFYQGRRCWIAANVGHVLGYENPARFAKKIRGEWAPDFIDEQDYEILSGERLNDFRELTRVGPGSGPSSKPLSPWVPRLLVLFESGIHMALMKTGKPIGRRLRRFLAEQVLPQLVRDGHYSPERKIVNDEIVTEASDPLSSPEWADPALAWLYAESDRLGVAADERFRIATAMVELKTGIELGRVRPRVEAAPSPRSNPNTAEADEALARFFESRCRIVRGLEIATTALYGAYAEWCDSESVRPLGNVHFGRAMKRWGLGHRRSNRTRYYTGIALNA